MTVKQIQYPIDMVTPLGEGQAMFTFEWPSMVWFGVVQRETGEIWWWPNHQVRVGTNISEQRYQTSEIKLSPEAEAALEPHRKRYKRRK